MLKDAKEKDKESGGISDGTEYGTKSGAGIEDHGLSAIRCGQLPGKAGG